MPPIRLLLLADTHLGFDLPFHPRVERRGRGPDFFANFKTALQPALRGEVDLVVHAGDLLYRSRVPPALVGQSGHQTIPADVRLLCLHQTVEGAKVGPSDYTSRGGVDVIRGRDIPEGFHYVLCGHIHRAQVLTRDLAGRPLAAPVVYPGSVERTAFAERDEEKGCMLLDLLNCRTMR